MTTKDRPRSAVSDALTAQRRAKLETQITEVEEDLARQRKRLAYWTLRKSQAYANPEIPAELRADAVYFQECALDRVMTAEKWCFILRRELKSLIAFPKVLN